jgi:hypothetical protein
VSQKQREKGVKKKEGGRGRKEGGKKEGKEGIIVVFLFLFCCFLSVLGIEPRALCILGKLLLSYIPSPRPKFFDSNPH